MQYRDDPFSEIPPGVPCSLNDVISTEDLHRSSFYQCLLAPDGTTDVLALNVVMHGTHVAYFRLSRRQADNPFGVLEKSLLTRLLPYLSNAFQLYEQRRRLLLERAAHIGALDQLAFGLVIIDEHGYIVRVNETAQKLLERSTLLSISDNRLRGPSPDKNVVNGSRVEAILEGLRQSHAPERIQFLRLIDASAGEFLQLLFKPIATPAVLHSASRCGVAVYLNDEVRNRDIYLGRFGQLYGLSPAEVVLLEELLQGSSITIAADKLGISENTARTQLRSVFSKTNVHRQAELIRLVLTSLAIIA
jgi:DNA-binding CsgD family transcriptional regulator